MSKKNISKAEKTRLQIIEKSAVLFNQKGFAGTSMGDIMDATGLSKGALYGHFNSKDEIAIASFQHAVKKVAVSVGQRTRVIDNTLDKLKAVVYFYKERILDPPVEGGCPIQNTSVDVDDNNPKLRAKVIAALDDWRDRIVHTINKGIKRGEISPKVVAKEFAIRFIGTLEGGILLAQLYKDVWYFDVLAKQLLQMIEELRAESDQSV